MAARTDSAKKTGGIHSREQSVEAEKVPHKPGAFLHFDHLVSGKTERINDGVIVGVYWGVHERERRFEITHLPTKLSVGSESSRRKALHVAKQLSMRLGDEANEASKKKFDEILNAHDNGNTIEYLRGEKDRGQTKTPRCRRGRG